MPPSRQATRIRHGLLKALNLSGVADGTELNNWNSWEVYENGGPGDGFYEIRGGEIRQLVSNTTQLALWGHADVAAPGQCVVADVFSSNWAANIVGLAANGLLDHSEDFRSFYFNDFEIRARAGADYGQGFLVASGALTGQPFTNGQWYNAKFGVVQETALSDPRMSGAFNHAVYQADNTASTGLNDGTDTYPGIISWANANTTRWRNLLVTHDYRLRVQGLTGTQGFRLYNAAGTVLKSSAAQSDNYATVNLIDLAWPIVGYLQIFNDAGTWADPVVGDGRWPAAGTAADIYGGAIIELPSLTILVQCNIDDTDAWPDFWTIPSSKLWANDVVDCLIDRRAANPSVEADTLTLELRDPERKYVPASTLSANYPHMRLNRKLRVVLEINGVYYPLFYGTIGGYKPTGQAGEKATTVRAESPLRAIANNQARPTVDADEVVGADTGSGAVWQVLEAIADLVPSDNRDLEPSPDVVPEDMQQQWNSPGEALTQLAILTDSLWFARPSYRSLTDEPDWVFVWQYRDAKVGVAADWTWNAATDGFSWDVEYTDDA